MGFYLKTCSKCLKGTMAVIAYITDGEVVHRILSHLGLPTALPAPSPARRPLDRDGLPFEDDVCGEAPWEMLDPDQDPQTRAPP